MARVCLAWLALLLFSYAPASQLVPLSFVIAERLLYMPCAACCVLVSVCLDGVTSWSQAP